MKSLDLAAWAAALLLASTLFAHTVALRLLLLLAGLSLVAVAIARDRQSLKLLPPIWLPLVLWAAWSVASLAWSVEPDRTAKELRNEIGYSIAAFWLCFVAAQTREAARIILPIVAAAAAAQCTVALQGYYAGGWHEYTLGLHGGPGNHSSAIVILAPCAVAAAWLGWRSKPPRWVPVAAVTLIALLVLSAYATLNRTIWLAFAVQAVALGVCAWRRGALGAPARGALIAAALAGVLAVGAGLVMQSIQSERGKVVSAMQSERGEVVREQGPDPRFGLWREALEKIAERPLTGYGFGRGLLRDSLRDEFNKAELWHSHNLFLDTALQTGIPGLLLLLALLGATLWRAWRIAGGASLPEAVCGAVLIAVVLGTIVRNMTDVLWVRQSAVLYWGAVGILLAWGTRYRTPAA